MLGREGTEDNDRLEEQDWRNGEGEAMGIGNPRPVTEKETPFLSQGLQAGSEVTDSSVLVCPG